MPLALLATGCLFGGGRARVANWSRKIISATRNGHAGQGDTAASGWLETFAEDGPSDRYERYPTLAAVNRRLHEILLRCSTRCGDASIEALTPNPSVAASAAALLRSNQRTGRGSA